MSVKMHIVKDYEGFKSLVQELDNKGEKVILYFVGAKMPDGKSWCPDCQNAEPIVKQFVSSNVKKDVNFVKIELERTYFKDPKNPFRRCNKVRLAKVPTLFYWRDVKRLEENECANVDLLKLFFEDLIHEK